MKTTERFDNAVRKLYKAFHNGTLNAMNCTQCAVGNICNNTSDWVGAKEGMSGFKRSYNNTGYSYDELIAIERIFMTGSVFDSDLYSGLNEKYPNWVISVKPIRWNGFDVKSNKENQFRALCAVVEFLCELDNIPNVLDYTKLFETEEGKPKYELA